MTKIPVNLHGATLYRVAFAIFVIACLLNAFDAYTAYVRISFNLSSLVREPSTMLNECWAFLGLAFILTLECVGLMMFKWTKQVVRRLA